MTPEEARAVAASLGFVPQREPEPLSGGNLNWVFRVRRHDPVDSAILKVSPPFVARVPDIPLDVGRSAQERKGLARAAEVLGPARVPSVRAHGDQPAALLLEDLAPDGTARDLGDLLRAGDPGVPELLRDLGRGIGQLHAATWGPDDHGLANRAVQGTRHEVQYRQVPSWLAANGHDPRLGDPVVALGERLRDASGRCLVMGDLWPASVLVRPGGDWALIDWELCHHGQPLQDVAHLLAHLRLLAPSDEVAEGWGKALSIGYWATSPAWPTSLHRDALLHEAAELLARSVGSFPLFDDGDPRIEQMVAVAVRLLAA